MTACAALVMENNSAIRVGHRRLLSADRLFDFEQVYVLPCPIWPWYTSQPAISPLFFYLSLSDCPVLMCVRSCVCVSVLLLAVSFQVKPLLYNHGGVSSPPAHHCTRIPASDIDPYMPSLLSVSSTPHTGKNALRVSFIVPGSSGIKAVALLACLSWARGALGSSIARAGVESV